MTRGAQDLFSVMYSIRTITFPETTVEPPVATTSPQRPVFQNTKWFQVKSLYLEPLVSDYLSSATSFPKYQMVPSQITILGTSCKRPPLVSEHLSSATSFPKYQMVPSQITIFGTSCKRPPLVSDHLSSATSFPKYQMVPSQITIFGTSRKRPPLLSDQFSKIPNGSKLNHYIRNLL